MQKSLWIMLAVLTVAISAPYASADIVTLDVSGGLSPVGGSSCSSSGCTLGGDIVIDNASGAIISNDVTFNGESPSVGPFNGGNGVGAVGALTELEIVNADSNAGLILVFSTITPGSLVGYSGGPLNGNTEIFTSNGCCAWFLVSGALTPAVTPAPEPSSAALMLFGVGLVFVMRKRIGNGLPQAS
ncbi:MAG: PEP-CTERM sorting domain-containing protein [Candidatus Acidiferrales bacterium]